VPVLFGLSVSSSDELAGLKMAMRGTNTVVEPADEEMPFCRTSENCSPGSAPPPRSRPPTMS